MRKTNESSWRETKLSLKAIFMREMLKIFCWGRKYNNLWLYCMYRRSYVWMELSQNCMIEWNYWFGCTFCAGNSKSASTSVTATLTITNMQSGTVFVFVWPQIWVTGSQSRVEIVNSFRWHYNWKISVVLFVEQTSQLLWPIVIVGASK